MSKRFEILAILGDGLFHSGEQLGKILKVSRTAVWKHLQALGELGLDIYAVPGKGYRLAAPLEMLQHDAIVKELSTETRTFLSGLELHHCLESTNAYLGTKAAAGLPSGYACMAEYQSAGRGRRGRTWISPYGANVYLSLLWCFTINPAAVSGLGLAVGVAICRALRQAGLQEIGLKWPNDVVWRGRKLAGTLLEITGESFGPVSVVIGIGLNVRMPESAGTHIDQAWVDLETTMECSVSRNSIAGRLLHNLLLVLHECQTSGLAPFIAEWRQNDIIAGKSIHLQLPNETITGIAKGVDQNGALLLQHKGKISSYTAGEVSIRL